VSHTAAAVAVCRQLLITRGRHAPGLTGWPKSKPQTFVHIVAKYLRIFEMFFTATFGGKFVIYHQTLTVSLHYLVKYIFSKITIITINA